MRAEKDLSDRSYAVSDAGVDSSAWLYQNAITNATSTPIGGADWNLINCCGRYETIFLSCMAAYLVIIAILWKTILMKPMKLIAVFVHAYELFFVNSTCRDGPCHCLLDESKCTATREVLQNMLVVGDGYVGGSFWCAVFVKMSGNRWGSLAASLSFFDWLY
ncbi:hypothetical protein ACHAXH_008551 [Discostella pseudostelligera]